MAYTRTNQPTGKHSGPMCGAKKANKREGSDNLCALPAGYGTDHKGFGRCKWHFGNTESNKVSAGREKAKQAIESFTGQVIDTDPIQALLDEVSRTAGHVAWLQARLSIWTMNTDVEIPASQKGWLDVYQYERMHLTRAAKVAIDAGVAQKQVALAEAQGQMLANAVNAILDGLNLSAEQRVLVPQLVPQVLRAVAIRADRPELEV